MRLCLIFFLFHLQVFSQQYFQRTYGINLNDVANCAIQTFDNNYLIGGSTADFPPNYYGDGILVKTDSLGNIIWTKVFHNNFFSSEISSVFQLGDSSLILFGIGSCILKLDKQGNLQWSAIYLDSISGFYIGNVLVCSDKGYMISGEGVSLTSDSTFMSMLKIDSLGNFQWSKKYVFKHYCDRNVIAETYDHKFIMTGSTADYGVPVNDYDIFILKTDSVGNPLWSKIYGTTKQDFASDMRIDNNDNIIIAGSQKGASFWDAAALVIKTDSSGNIIWSKTYSGTGPAECSSLLISNSKYLLAGHEIFQGYSDALLIKTDTAGTLLSFEPFGTNDPDEIRCMAWTKDSSIILTGFRSSSNFVNNSISFTKTDALLNLGCTFTDLNFSELTVNFIPYSPTLSIQNLQITDTFLLFNDSLVALNQNTICEPMEVKMDTGMFEFKIFPNPFNDYIELQSLNESGIIKEIRFNNYLGQCIKTISICIVSNKFHLATDNFPDGFYTCNIILDNLVMHSTKIIHFLQ